MLLLMMIEITMRLPHDPTKNDVNINDNYDDEGNDYDVTPDTPTSGEINETIDNDEEKIMKKRLIRKHVMKT